MANGAERWGPGRQSRFLGSQGSTVEGLDSGIEAQTLGLVGLPGGALVATALNPGQRAGQGALWERSGVTLCIWIWTSLGPS
eukprot:5866268-Pyramimonas_sp.AAC.1